MRSFSLSILMYLAYCHVPANAGPAEPCVTAFERAASESRTVFSPSLPYSVAGDGRLYFHSAPGHGCELKNTFVVAGDKLEVYAQYAGFSQVIFWHPRTGVGTAGWVLTSRLATSVATPGKSTEKATPR